MSGGGGDSPVYTPKGYDPNDIASFMKTQNAAPFTPEQLSMLHETFNVQQGPNPLAPMAPFKDGRWQPVNLDMVNAFEGWVAANNQTKQNWNNYASLVNANQGGEGDSTITSGPAQSQRNQLLGALAGNVTKTPTPGLGSFGTLLQNGKPMFPGSK